jgi:elongation factor Ts
LTIDQYRSIIIQKIGENIQIRRVATFEKKPNVSMGVYSHMGGKIIALVELTGSEDQTGCARNLAMHVAAARPQYLTPDSVPEDIRARELDIAREQVKDKPEHIMDKILDGKMRAFESDTCMVSQRYVRDDKRTVQEFIDSCGKESGSALSVANFVYWKVGE